MIPSQTPPIPNLEVSDYVTSHQQARQRQRQKRNQRRREQREELQRQQEAQRRQQQERRLRRRDKNLCQYERRQERRQQQQRKHQQQREQEQKDRRERINNMQQLFNSFKRRIYSTYKENFFTAYDLQNMYETEWFQHRHVNDRGTFPTDEQFDLLEDEIEQLRQIDAAQMLKEEEKEERNNRQLTYFEQSEALEFLAQQAE